LKYCFLGHNDNRCTQPKETIMSFPISRQKRGFTLIELLVVIAIIALLAAILFPVFARARENARKSSCANNVKQLALGWMQYTQDFDELAIPQRTGAAGTPIFNWPQLLTPYLKSPQIFVCPSNTSGRGQSYTYNIQLAGFGTPKALADIPQVSIVPLFADARGSNTADQCLFFQYGNAAGQVYARRRNGAAPPTHEDSAEALIRADIHLEGANYAYVDGHVKWRKSLGALPGAATYAGGATPPAGSAAPPTQGHDYNIDGDDNPSVYD
jgi:prepilin-type N-terminal cleavage/methylation domain-containing protein/prepilin-type processing-associated H-X9-DG protein